MTHILHPIEFRNGMQNESNQLQKNPLLLLEFDLFDRKSEKKLVSAGIGIIVFLGILLLMLEIIGNYLLFCMVWYEKFGMDSMKRTITNQLLSRMILALIFFSIFFMPLHFSALLIPFSEYFQGFIIEGLNYVQFTWLSHLYSNILLPRLSAHLAPSLVGTRHYIVE